MKRGNEYTILVPDHVNPGPKSRRTIDVKMPEVGDVRLRITVTLVNEADKGWREVQIDAAAPAHLQWKKIVSLTDAELRDYIQYCRHPRANYNFISFDYALQEADLRHLSWYVYTPLP